MKGECRNKSNKGTWELFLIFSLICVGVVLLGYYIVPQVELSGSSVVILNYKEDYQEIGYKARVFNDDISNQVNVSGVVDSSKLGSYTITYELDGLFKKKVTRTVVVKDKQKPTLSLSSDVNIYLCPGEEFKKEEVLAFDNYDGDISDRVEVNINRD